MLREVYWKARKKMFVFPYIQAIIKYVQWGTSCDPIVHKGGGGPRRLFYNYKTVRRVNFELLSFQLVLDVLIKHMQV